MRRAVLLAIAALAVIGAGAGVALADQGPPGFGKPAVSKGVGAGLIRVPTGPCSGFAIDNALTFPYSSTSLDKYWGEEDTPSGVGFIDSKTKISGSLSSGGFSYTIRADLDGARYIDSDWLGSGKVTLTRSDGQKVVGDATVGFDPSIFTTGLTLYWATSVNGDWQTGTPTCK